MYCYERLPISQFHTTDQSTAQRGRDGDFAQVRNNCFHVDNVKELFQDIHIDSIMTFLRQINLFNKI